MKLAIMQPYLFPYIGYFSLINYTDHFVFFDTPQYIKKGWINRNRILGSGGKDIYFIVPVEKVPRETAIKDVPIFNGIDWKEKWKGQLSIYKKRAPYYKDVVNLIDDVFAVECKYVSELAIASIVSSCQYLGIDFKYDVYSQMNLPTIEVNAPDEWALQITKKMGYDVYVNPPGGKSFFDPKKYQDSNIELQFLAPDIKAYNQRNNGFIPGLSIIDIMMFCSPKEISDMMDSFILESTN
ncbi:MAG: WbqC family protein [Lachnospiraceae bacterium]|nr:WbqC family protein [Lachnospiraceae bacterium]